LSLADLRRERNELAPAARHLDEAFARSTTWNLLISQLSSLFVRARLQGAQGDPEAALAILEEADKLAPRQTTPLIAWIAPLFNAYRAQLWLALGRLDAAAGLAARIGAPTTAPPLLALSAQFIIYDYEHLAVAPIQVLIAQGRATGDPAPLRTALD